MSAYPRSMRAFLELTGKLLASLAMIKKQKPLDYGRKTKQLKTRRREEGRFGFDFKDKN